MSTIDDEREVAPPYEEVLADTVEAMRNMSTAEAALILTDTYFWGEQGPGFSCIEANALAVLIWRGLEPDANMTIEDIADLVVSGHGQPGRSEDGGDEHWHTPKER